MKTVLSVDVAKNKSMIMLMNSDGEIFIDTKEINHNLEDFEKVKEEIKEINPQNLTVFMESTGTYHLPVERYFKENGFNTLVINSLTTKNNYDTIRKTKTDKKDCYRLAKLFCQMNFLHDKRRKKESGNVFQHDRHSSYCLPPKPLPVKMQCRAVRRPSGIALLK